MCSIKEIILDENEKNNDQYKLPIQISNCSTENLDEVPVGAHKNSEFALETSLDHQEKEETGPLEKRVDSKN